MRVSKFLKAPKVRSCVACAFEGIDYVNLEAFWQILRQNSDEPSSKILRYVLALSHKTRF